MLRADGVVTHPARFLKGGLYHLLDPRRRDDLLNDDSLVATKYEFDRVPNHVDFNAKVGKRLGANPVLFSHDAKEKVFGPDVAVAGALSLLLGECQYSLGTLCEPFKRIDGVPRRQG